jgi:hypothetical protein
LAELVENHLHCILPLLESIVEMGRGGSRYLFGVLERRLMERFELGRIFKREKMLEERMVMMSAS